MLVRPGSPEDARACVGIYRPYVEDTAITFETEVPGIGQMAERIAAARELHEWLVIERDHEVVGYAYAHTFNPRPAYRWAAETSVYLAAGHHGAGNGRKLYARLLDRLAESGYRRAFAGITQPNEGSNALHRSMGFQPAGLFRRVGWKNGDWHDVAWMQLDLAGAVERSGRPTEIT